MHRNAESGAGRYFDFPMNRWPPVLLKSLPRISGGKAVDRAARIRFQNCVSVIFVRNSEYKVIL